MKISYDEKIRLKKESLKQKISMFSNYYFEKDIKELCLKLVDLMSEQDHIMFMEGKLKNWASAIIYLIAKNNYMFENLIYETLDVKNIDDFFNTKSTFYRRLANRIDDKLNISETKEFKIREDEDLDSMGHFNIINDNGNIYFIDNKSFVYFIC